MSHSACECMHDLYRVRRCDLRIWDHLFAADSMGLSSLTSAQRARKKAIHGKVVTQCVTIIQDHLRSLTLLPIESAYVISY